MAFTIPSIDDFKNQFVRDFPYGTDMNVCVLDSDINYAFAMTTSNFNPGLFQDQNSFTIAYNLLTAHFMVLNIRASSQGINGQYNFLQQSKGAGQVNEAFAIPTEITDDPTLSMLTKTNYGAAYLSMVLSLIRGSVSVVYGATSP